MSEPSARAHSKYGGSTATRWITCPGSVELCESLPPLPESKWAREGTFAHELGQCALAAMNRNVMDCVGAALETGLKYDLRVEEEMARAVQVYVDEVLDAVDACKNGEFFIEERFEIDVKTAEKGEVFGRNDAMLYDPDKCKLTVWDLKYGAGISIKAENNNQGLFYATGALLARPDWPIKSVEVVIVQPRAMDVAVNGAIRRWEFSPFEILEFAATLEVAIERAKQPNAEFKSGSHCRFCAGAAICPAIQKDALRDAGLAFGSVKEVTVKDLPAPRKINPQDLGKTLRAIELLEDWGKQVKEFAFNLAQSGVPIPDWKLVDKMARRKWTGNEEEVAGYLAMIHGLDVNEVRPPKLQTITEIERLLAAKIPDKNALRKAKDDLSVKYTIKESSGLTLVPASDKRDPVAPPATAAFSAVQLQQ